MQMVHFTIPVGLMPKVSKIIGRPNKSWGENTGFLTGLDTSSKIIWVTLHEALFIS